VIDLSLILRNKLLLQKLTVTQLFKKYST
jgi:hypothetical protein